MVYCGDLVLLDSLRIGIVLKIHTPIMSGKIVNTEDRFEINESCALSVYRRITPSHTAESASIRTGS